jgi:hypothetical protein
MKGITAYMRNALTGTFIFRAPPAKAAVASKALSVGTGYF